MSRHDHADRHPRGVIVDRGDAGQLDIAKGPTQQFTATGTYTDDSTQNLTSAVTWTSAQPRSPRSQRPGLATALAAGAAPSISDLGRRDRRDHADGDRRLVARRSR